MFCCCLPFVHYLFTLDSDFLQTFNLFFCSVFTAATLHFPHWDQSSKRPITQSWVFTTVCCNWGFCCCTVHFTVPSTRERQMQWFLFLWEKREENPVLHGLSDYQPQWLTLASAWPNKSHYQGQQCNHWPAVVCPFFNAGPGCVDWTGSGLQENQQNAMNRNPMKWTEQEPGENKMAQPTSVLLKTHSGRRPWPAEPCFIYEYFLQQCDAC